MNVIMRSTDYTLFGKKVMFCGYGEVGKGCAQVMRSSGARMFVSEIDPLCAKKVVMEGMRITTLEDVVGGMDADIKTTGNKDIVSLEHIDLMKNFWIAGNIGHLENQIDVARLAGRDGD